MATDKYVTPLESMTSLAEEQITEITVEDAFVLKSNSLTYMHYERKTSWWIKPGPKQLSIEGDEE